MRTGLSIISIALWLVANAYTQNNPGLDKPLPKPIARISYSTGIMESSQLQGPPKFCFALFGDGFYRMSRLTFQGSTEKVQGMLSGDQLAAIQQLLETVKFQSGGGGIVQNNAESFIAEIVRNDKTGRYSWVDPDHRKPLPESAENVVKWLRKFKPQSEEPIDSPELTEDPICPPASTKPAQPVASMIF
jgi:hypothetical protein